LETSWLINFPIKKTNIIQMNLTLKGYNKMDQITEDAVQRIVEALVEDRAMFSLHDVTTLCRADNLVVRHYGRSGVREFVNALLANPMFADYIATSNGEFNILHHYEDDVNDYDRDEHRSASPAATPNSTGTVSLSPTAPAFVAPVDDGKVATDQRGRLCVRAALLRKLGVSVGDKVSVDFDIAGILPADGTACFFLIVDKDNCLRLSGSVLYKMFGANMPTNARYRIDFHDDVDSPWIEIG